ncbi:MAG: hypothetical protein HKN26_13350 [Acidimicrobiales bacterium]|nr:hypothetical protein [Acidimicrobiales bacterium]
MTATQHDEARPTDVPPATEGAYPRRDNCTFEPLVDGVPAFRRICEAIEAATTSVWGTVAFLEHDAPMPDGRGSMFDVLARAAARGVDVRVIFWRSDVAMPDEHFPGTEAQRAWLHEQGFGFTARWDALPGESCVHQKSWLVDAGTADEVAFIGGINLDPGSTSSDVGHHPDTPHGPNGNIHDIYTEVRGPAGTDVHHNFVQRWNESTERHSDDGHWPSGADGGDLPFPTELSRGAGSLSVQITRTVSPDRYRNSHPAVGAEPFPIAGGERSVYEQYISAIDVAQHAIYLEDQVIGSPKVVGHLQRALDRGVHVVFVVPGRCHTGFHAARLQAADSPFMQLFDAFDEYTNFTLAALSAQRPDGTYDETYIHSKLMIVDDVWATIGSTNTATQSFRLDTELNASCWHPETAKSLRVELFREHLDDDTDVLGPVEAAEHFAATAQSNRQRRELGQPLVGLAHRIEASAYGYDQPMEWIRSMQP